MLFFQIRPEFTSELRLRAHLFAAHFACLNQEADKASAGIGFALDHYQKAAPAPIFLSKQMFLWSSTHQMSGATLREKKKKKQPSCASVFKFGNSLRRSQNSPKNRRLRRRGLLWLFRRAFPPSHGTLNKNCCRIKFVKPRAGMAVLLNSSSN